MNFSQSEENENAIWNLANYCCNLTTRLTKTQKVFSIRLSRFQNNHCLSTFFICMYCKMAQKLLTICKSITNSAKFCSTSLFLFFTWRIETLLNGSFCDMHTILILLQSLTIAFVFELIYHTNHYVLRALKTSQSCSRCQTYVFESRIAQGIQKWVQNNQLLELPSNDFFKKLFSEQKNHQKSWKFCWFLNFYGNIHE